MMVVGPPQPQCGFGPSVVADCARRPCQQIRLPNDLVAARKEALANVPVCPGVYGWRNSDGTFIYVGKAKSLRHRLSGYFATQTSDPKMARIRRNSAVLMWEPVSHELLALVREQELIDRFRPPYNVQGKPERRQPGFLCLDKGPAPSIFFSRTVPRQSCTSIGPFAGRGELREAVTSMNYVFQLRDCPDRTPMRFSNQLQLFDNGVSAGCLRFELSSCPGPCAGGCSRAAYEHHVRRARKFLEGRDMTMLKRLEERLRRAIEQLAFERAAVLAGQLRHLKWLERRVRQLNATRRKLNGIWVLPGFDHRKHWMIVRGGNLVACRTAPLNGSPDRELGEFLASTAAGELSVPESSLAVNWFLLLGAWARRFPDQAGTVIPFDAATGRDNIGNLPNGQRLPRKTG
jgi:excinuclease ABC subunit C